MGFNSYLHVSLQSQVLVTLCSSGARNESRKRYKIWNDISPPLPELPQVDGKNYHTTESLSPQYAASEVDRAGLILQIGKLLV